MKFPAILLALFLGFAPAFADTSVDHAKMMEEMMQGTAGQVTEPGQSAFAAIAEIVAKLRNDPGTDWSTVNIAALQQHLADMDTVTLHTDVTIENVNGGAAFTVKGRDASGIAAVQRMMLAHAPFLLAETGFAVAAEANAQGGKWTVTSQRPGDEAQIRALGFYGLLATGGHHQMHHLAIATGQMMH